MFAMGGIFIQILIQAAILRLSLKLIAKHEADTTYTKAIMVTAGVSIGQLIVAFMAASIHPIAILPAVIAFTAAVIMFACWISFWKSLLVVFLYMVIQGIFVFIMVLITGGAVALSMLGIGSPTAQPKPDPHYEQIAAAQQEAMRMQQKAMQKQAQMEAEIRRMEQESGYPPAPPLPMQPTPIPTPKPEPEPTPEPKPEPKPMPQPTPEPQPEPEKAPAPAAPDLDWQAARQQVRIGGIMAGGKGFLALINGKMVNPGDKITADYNGKQYRWTVKTISSKEVKLKQLDALDQ